MAAHSTTGATGATERRPTFEVRSIDYVPLNERHGKLWHLGPLWFMSNAQIATLAVGVLGVTTGGTSSGRSSRSCSESLPARSSWRPTPPRDPSWDCRR